MSRLKVNRKLFLFFSLIAILSCRESKNEGSIKNNYEHVTSRIKVTHNSYPTVFGPPEHQITFSDGILAKLKSEIINISPNKEYEIRWILELEDGSFEINTKSSQENLGVVFLAAFQEDNSIKILKFVPWEN
jgi:hypothetical protein